jgi:hypothetical protein
MLSFDEIPLDEANFVVVDVETTGMNAHEDRITEIAMLAAALCSSPRLTGYASQHVPRPERQG